MPDPENATAEWYAAGLRFECTQCGNCCTGPPGHVWFTPEEGRAIARRLGMTESAFLAAHARRVGARWSLNERRTEAGLHDCDFLDRTSRPGVALCSIYEVRPMQCRTWPFWPENLSSRGAWSQTRQRTPCPGMDRGPLIPVEQIRIIREQCRF
jgi:hypothetical protein